MLLVSSNVFWSGLEAAMSAMLSFLAAFVVARIVGPAEVGVGASVVAVHVLLWVVVNALFADALVQRATVSEEEASSAFWASGLAGLGAAAVQAAMGWVLAATIGDSRLVTMSLVLALPLPLVGAAGATQGMLTRNRHYKVLAGRAVIGQGLGTLSGIALALAGAGAWALVAQQLLTSVIGALALVLRARWRPRLVLRLGPVRGLLRVGLPLVVSTMVLHSRYRLFALLIGGTAGAAELGHVHMAFRLVDTVRDLVSTALWRLILPVLSQRQHDLAGLRRSTSRFLALSGLAVFPMLGAMLVVIQPLVQVLLGPVWASSAIAAAPLVLFGLYDFLTFPATIALVARGITRIALVGSLATTTLVVAGVLVLRPATPLNAAWVWIGAQLLVAPALRYVTARALDDGIVTQLAAGIPPLVLTVVATAAAMAVPYLLGEPADPWLLMAERLAVGGMVYVPCAAMLLRGSLLAALRSVGLRRRPA